MIKPFCGAIAQSGDGRNGKGEYLTPSLLYRKERYAVPERNIVKLIQPVNVEDQHAGVPTRFGRGAVHMPVPRGEKPSLCRDKNEMEDFRRSDSLMPPFMRVSGKMPNDKLREVKRAGAPELRRPRWAPAVTTQPVKVVMDRPQLLSDRLRLRSNRRKIENDDVVVETFTLPLEAARLKVRDIIDGISQRGYQEVVERWRQLPSGQIEFTVRHLPIAD
jgi:hypothetical protein